MALYITNQILLCHYIKVYLFITGPPAYSDTLATVTVLANPKPLITIIKNPTFTVPEVSPIRKFRSLERPEKLRSFDRS